jgi:hypothetical protein
MDKVGRIKIMISRLDDRESVVELSKYCRERLDILWQRKHERSKLDHVAKIKALNPGALVMVRQNSSAWRVGEIGEIAYHKPRAPRSIVQFQDSRFVVPCGWLDSDFDLAKQRAAVQGLAISRKLAAFTNKVFNSISK